MKYSVRAKRVQQRTAKVVKAVMDEDGGGRVGVRVQMVGADKSETKCGEKKKDEGSQKMMKRSRGKWMSGQRPNWT